jgi:hypothetical protein
MPILRLLALTFPTLHFATNGLPSLDAMHVLMVDLNAADESELNWN